MSVLDAICWLKCGDELVVEFAVGLDINWWTDLTLAV